MPRKGAVQLVMKHMCARDLARYKAWRQLSELYVAKTKEYSKMYYELLKMEAYVRKLKHEKDTIDAKVKALYMKAYRKYVQSKHKKGT